MGKEQQPKDRGLREAASGVPALLGLGAAALYGVGVVYEVNALRGAGLGVADVFPLVPVEENLMRGVAVLLTPATLFLIAIQVSSMNAGHQFREASKAQGQEKGRRYFVGLLVFAAVLLVLFSPIPTAVYAGVMFSSGVLGVRLLYRMGLRRGVAPVLAIAVSFLLGNVARVYADPPELPRATVDLKEGPEAAGTYVAVRDNTVVVAGERGRYQRIPLQQVKMLRIVPPPLTDCDPSLAGSAGLPEIVPDSDCRPVQRAGV